MISSRYASYILYALLAGFIVVASQSFGPSTVGWLAFGAGAAFTVLGGAAMLRRGSLASKAINAGVGVLGVLLILESLLAAGASVIWLSFAGSLGVLGLALAGLTIHELTTERVVHSFEPSPGERRERASVGA